MTMDDILAKADKIEIVSGEGNEGTAEDYKGRMTERAICMRLIKEECHGDRWAFVRIDDVRYDRKGYTLEMRF